VIPARGLVALGVPESTVYDRCRDGGPWQRLAPGIVLLTNGRPSGAQLVEAALAHCGPGALLTGLEACRRHGVRRGPSPTILHTLVPHSRQVRSTGIVDVERTRRLPQAVVRDGMPLAPAARAVTDAARRLRDGGDIAELISDAVQRSLCTVDELRSELDDGGQRGSATPRRVLRAAGAGIRSAAELDAQRLWWRSGLPEPWWNVPVLDAEGRLLGIADAWFDEVALAWEINSYAWHLAPADYAREQARLARFVAAGVLVLPTLARRLRIDAAGVLKELTGAYAAAAARPRPSVRAERACPRAAG
jgi:hypothetical protein